MISRSKVASNSSKSCALPRMKRASISVVRIVMSDFEWLMHSAIEREA